MRTLKLVFAYDGTNYHGFQRQNNAVAIQQLIEDMLSKVCNEPIQVAASGRTDAGVHARYQVVSFSTTGIIPTENLVKVAPSFLPEDIVLLEATEVDVAFHARKSACWKRYCYNILQTELKDPFKRNYAWQMKTELDIAAMQNCADFIIGTHDFSAYKSAGSADVSPIKTIYEAVWSKDKNNINFAISGDGFVYHMVRNLVWAMVQVGLKKASPEDFKAELEAAKRHFKNAPAPAQGLYLDYVGYEPYKKT